MGVLTGVNGTLVDVKVRVAVNVIVRVPVAVFAGTVNVGVNVGVPVNVNVLVKVGLKNAFVGVIVAVATGLQVQVETGVSVAVAVSPGAVCVHVTVSVSVTTSVTVPVSSGVSVSTIVGVSGTTQAARVTPAEIYDTLSILGPPPAVKASTVISFLPATRATCTVASSHVSHVPVAGKIRFEGCTTSLTMIRMSLFAADPFANLYVRVRFCAAMASTKNIIEEPVVLSRLA